MTELGKRLQKARTALHLSQEYVARQLDIDQPAISQIESGNRKVTSEELDKFSKIYGISANDLLAERSLAPSQMFARKFNRLDVVDQQEVLNLMEFKRMMKERKAQ